MHAPKRPANGPRQSRRPAAAQAPIAPGARRLRSRERRRPPSQVARLAERDQNRANRIRVLDRRDQPQPPAAARAGEYVDVEVPSHQIGPRPVTNDWRRLVGPLGACARDRPCRRWRAVRNHPGSPAGMGRQHAVVEHQIEARPRMSAASFSSSVSGSNRSWRVPSVHALFSVSTMWPSARSRSRSCATAGLSR